MDGSCSRPPRVALIALGCRVSRADVDALAAELRGGCEIARGGERADLVVLNTCALTAGAESTARRAIRRAAREHPQARIVAAGCCAEVRPEALAGLPGVAAVVGARSPARVADAVARLCPGAPPAAGRAAAAGLAAAATPRAGPRTGTSRVRWPSAGEARGEVVRVRVVGSDGEECLGVRAQTSTARLPP
ncbi:MAG TPA: hypothetical protein VIW03_05700 [Anaeromyxobacter sp.]